MKNLSVYLVDDDEDDRAIFCEVTKEINPSIACITFNNGAEAIQCLQTATTPPDFIFLDLNMPRLSGRQCLEKIKQQKELSCIPVIIYTTSKLTRDISDSKNLGADYFITKPSDLDKLKQELEFVIDKKWEA